MMFGLGPLSWTSTGPKASYSKARGLRRRPIAGFQPKICTWTLKIPKTKDHDGPYAGYVLTILGCCAILLGTLEIQVALEFRGILRLRA